MKVFLGCLFFFTLTSGKIYAQSDSRDFFRLDSLPAEGVLLNKGWMFHAANDPRLPRPGYTASGEKPIDPLLPLYRLPEIKQPGVGWLKLRLMVDSSLQNKTIAVVLTFAGAAEFYLDGRLLYRFGKISADFKEERTCLFFNRPFSLKLGNQASQELVIKYALHPKNLYINFGDHPSMSVGLKDINQAFTDYIDLQGGYQNRRSIQLFIYLPLGLLLLFLFLAFRIQKEYLHFGISSLCFCLGIMAYTIALRPSVTVAFSNTMVLLQIVFYITGVLFFLTATYILHQQKKSWIYYMMLLYGMLIIPALLFFDRWGYLLNFFFFPLVVLDFLRLNIKAVRNGRKGAIILVITAILFFIFIACGIFLLISGNRVLSDFFTAVSFITPAIGLSLFVSGEFARTGLSLQQRVREVEDLSQKTISQEKEKQQILSSQNEILEKQVIERTSALKLSLEELRSAQSQLIQSEKMASLGELTAGIAHEIQNPLNFVNNFSEVNRELLGEMKEEIEKGNLGEVRSIAQDVFDNEEKINHHGRRADAIVKGMLQHSRSSSGTREPTNINALVDEYLRLASHGLRVKDKAFTTRLETAYDESITDIRIIPQDIGRVVLNVINNAFYAMAEKRKLRGADYEPALSVSTNRVTDGVEISVKDNGVGISPKLVDKIFQPFFTTKPTGQGTGLGLSLSYDIIKAHGGNLTVLSKEGEGAEFIISLSI